MGVYDLELEELRSLLAGEAPYRASQVWHGLYSSLRAPEEMTDLPLALRVRLAGSPELGRSLELASERATDGGLTTKWLYRLADGSEIETVLMRYTRRATVCVSTQAGCAMGCRFCATGQGGFKRNLTAGEIIEQVVRAAAAATSGPPGRLSNVVLMGMGEPLANLRAVEPAVVRIERELDISARHVTVSTVGVVPGILRLAARDFRAELAVSLHAANDALRDELIPINRRWPLESLARACEKWTASRSRRLSLEWACMKGVNDSEKDLDELAAFASRLRAHVNLIPLNPTPGWPVEGSDPARVSEMAKSLADRAVAVSIRANRGGMIDAACGQLAMRTSIGRTRRSALATSSDAGLPTAHPS